MRAALLTTPAISPTLAAAVNLQRDGAVDPAQRGSEPPLTLQKRELASFLQRLGGSSGYLRS